MQPDLISEDSAFTFGEGFLDDHVGHIITDPGIAILELIANSYDAGATEVLVTWPEKQGEKLGVQDNGIGMTLDEFNSRWKKLKYNRLEEQGEDVVFPPGTKSRKRKAFGRSGKGRHGAFCFSDRYEITTKKAGKKTIAVVSRAIAGYEPFHCEIISNENDPSHGTLIEAIVTKNLEAIDRIKELVGSKFAVDPEFLVYVNGEKINLLSLDGIQTEVVASQYGEVKVHEIQATQIERNTRFRGITWWTNKRMVGNSSWSGLDEKGAILDGRTAAAKKYSFIIEADMLQEEVKPDWSGYFESKRSVEITDLVKEHVIKRLHVLLADSRRERKLSVIAQHRDAIGELPILSQRVVGEFIDEVQQNCPTLSEADLSRTVEVLAKLEQSRSGYDLLENLANGSPDDLDTWNRLLQQWTATHAEIILNELGRRLRLIDDLTRLIHDSSSDELHDLQPLFARGLWIFGPEYESPEFMSNRGMATVIRKLLGGTEDSIKAERPDLVVLPDSSIGIYAADSHDDTGEPNGFRSVVIVELKKGGFNVTVKELRQAEDYVRDIRKAKLVQDTTKITAFVLGATIEDDEIIRIGEGDRMQIIPLAYDIILRKAHARTFNLMNRLEKVEPARFDEDVKSALEGSEAGPLFASAAG